ncbi:hypothetical protein NC99_16280 [Sunxiuqinia dokdonensis]|uniref:Uncharacterized protein n=1 Tax=Sunxiuqinia dokdonensis TaxID=1409788 RepID=A0A0L8VAP6_9BACT|nr:hypothetical protein NC99_16280 [Sunxiuqinia dokdonensis]
MEKFRWNEVENGCECLDRHERFLTIPGFFAVGSVFCGNRCGDFNPGDRRWPSSGVA